MSESGEAGLGEVFRLLDPSAFDWRLAESTRDWTEAEGKAWSAGLCLAADTAEHFSRLFPDHPAARLFGAFAVTLRVRAGMGPKGPVPPDWLSDPQQQEPLDGLQQG